MEGGRRYLKLLATRVNLLPLSSLGTRAIPMKVFYNHVLLEPYQHQNCAGGSREGCILLGVQPRTFFEPRGVVSPVERTFGP